MTLLFAAGRQLSRSSSPSRTQSSPNRSPSRQSNTPIELKGTKSYKLTERDLPVLHRLNSSPFEVLPDRSKDNVVINLLPPQLKDYYISSSSNGIMRDLNTIVKLNSEVDPLYIYYQFAEVIKSHHRFNSTVLI